VESASASALFSVPKAHHQIDGASRFLRCTR